MKEAKSSGAGFIILLAALASSIWIVALWYLFISSAPCGESPTLGFTTRWIACRKANEIGDFLAGAFAPVAFVWLAVAVLIQSAELKAQREEFSLSRQVAEETREAIKAQAEEARKQVEYISTQTQILKDAEASRIGDQKAAEFGALVTKLAGALKSRPHAGVVTGSKLPDSFGVMQFDLLRPRSSFNDGDPTSFIRFVTTDIEGRFDEFRSGSYAPYGPYEFIKRSDFRFVLDAFSEAASAYDSLPRSSQILADDLGLRKALGVLTVFLSTIENPSNPV